MFGLNTSGIRRALQTVTTSISSNVTKRAREGTIYGMKVGSLALPMFGYIKYGENIAGSFNPMAAGILASVVGAGLGGTLGCLSGSLYGATEKAWDVAFNTSFKVLDIAATYLMGPEPDKITHGILGAGATGTAFAYGMTNGSCAEIALVGAVSALSGGIVARLSSVGSKSELDCYLEKAKQTPVLHSSKTGFFNTSHITSLSLDKTTELKDEKVDKQEEKTPRRLRSSL